MVEPADQPRTFGRGRGGPNRGSGRGGGRGGKPNDDNHPMGRQHRPNYEKRIDTDYLEKHNVDQGKLKGIFFECRYIYKRDPDSSYADCSDFEKGFVVPTAHKNRAIHGDTVAVEILSPEKWEEHKKKPDEPPKLEPEVREMYKQAFLASTTKEEKVNSLKELMKDYRITVKVVAIEKRALSDNYIYCTLHVKDGFGKTDLLDFYKSPDYIGMSIIARPSMSIYPQFVIRNLPEEFKQDAEEGSTTQVENRFYALAFSHWEMNKGYPVGILQKSLGIKGRAQDEGQKIIFESNLAHSFWDQSPTLDFFKTDIDEFIAKHTKEGELVIPEEEYKSRTDLREHCVITIDADETRVLDDAISVKDLGDGFAQVGVHIADCSHYIQPGSEFDKEARKRGETLYFHYAAYFMLPLEIVDWMSLEAKKERLAFSCMFKVKIETGEIVEDSCEFKKTIIQSASRWNYYRLQHAIDQKELLEASPDQVPREPFTEDQISRDMRLLNEIAKKSLQRRIKAGLVDHDNRDLQFKFEEGDMQPRAYVEVDKDTPDAKQTVSELMCLANICAARFMKKYSTTDGVFRCQPAPTAENIAKLVEYYAELGIVVTSDMSKQEIVDALLKAPPGDLQTMMTMKLRMSNCAASIKPRQGTPDEELGHWSINEDAYTQFTSPLRKYLDLTVHRIIKGIIEGQEHTYATEQFCEEMRKTLKQHKNACRTMMNRMMSMLLAQQPLGQRTFSGLIFELGFNINVYDEEYDRVEKIIVEKFISRDVPSNFAYTQNYQEQKVFVICMRRSPDASNYDAISQELIEEFVAAKEYENYLAVKAKAPTYFLELKVGMRMEVVQKVQESGGIKTTFKLQEGLQLK